jgi:glycosyltransferase involved in cell wall biosynthesis
MKIMANHEGSRNTVRVLACATEGTGGEDERRLTTLVSAFEITVFNFTKREKWRRASRLLRLLRSRSFDLFVVEGSGLAVGLSAILGRWVWRVPYVLSSGDAVAPFLTARLPWGKPFFSMYERALYANCSGFIGWTPYLVGRALSSGAPRAITIPGWAPFTLGPAALHDARRSIRERLHIPDDAIVFGIIGSLNWSERYQYCYGAELIRAARIRKTPAYVLIVGDGTGLHILRKMAGEQLGSTILLTGRIPRDEVPSYLAAMDVGSIPQSVNAVGNFRYSTKLSEYRAAGLPFISNQIPMAYDLDDGKIWRLPGKSPWDSTFIEALSDLMANLTTSEIAEKTRTASTYPDFDKETQVARTTSFLKDVLAADENE